MNIHVYSYLIIQTHVVYKRVLSLYMNNILNFVPGQEKHSHSRPNKCVLGSLLRHLNNHYFTEMWKTSGYFRHFFNTKGFYHKFL